MLYQWQQEKSNYLFCTFSLIWISYNTLIRFDTSNKDIQIWVFYDALCGDSHFYFKNSFRNFYNSINQLNPKISLNIIPGALEKFDGSLTNQNNDYNDFICEHGENECFANAVHSCALFFFEKSISFNFVDSYFDNLRELGLDINQTSEFCLKKINKDKSFSNLFECASGLSGKLQINKNIQMKENVQGKINRSPSNVINKVFNGSKEDEIEADTLGYLCKNYRIDNLFDSDICKAYKENNFGNYHHRKNYYSKLKKESAEKRLKFQGLINWFVNWYPIELNPLWWKKKTVF